MKRRLLTVVCAGVLFLVAAGCSPHKNPQVRFSATASGQSVCRLAILPFVNETDQRTAAVKAYRIFLGELVASGDYQVEPEGEVYFFFNRHRILPGELLDSGLYARLARQLDVDVLIRGRVIAMSDGSGTQRDTPLCALQIDLLSAENGELLVSTYHRRRGDEYQKILHFGTIYTTSALLAQMSREIVSEWRKEGLNSCSPN